MTGPTDSRSDGRCLYCGKDESIHRYDTVSATGDTFGIRKCGFYQTQFLSPHPSAEQLRLAYDESYYGEGEEKFDGLMERALDFFRKQRARRLVRLVGSGGKVLDVGCGNGRFLHYVSKLGKFDIHGVESAISKRLTTQFGDSHRLILDRVNNEQEFDDFWKLFRSYALKNLPDTSPQLISRLAL